MYSAEATTIWSLPSFRKAWILRGEAGPDQITSYSAVALSCARTIRVLPSRET
jgi:hypothetical protein